MTHLDECIVDEYDLTSNGAGSMSVEGGWVGIRTYDTNDLLRDADPVHAKHNSRGITW
jgi:hypothetical protein